MELKGTTVLLTGATGGIGSALCDALVAAGARVLAVGRDAARLAELERRHPLARVVPFRADIATGTGRAELLAFARSLQPTPALLVMAHAQGAFGLFGEQDETRMREMLETNLVSPMLLIRGALPMLQAHPRSAVVAIGSTFGSLAFPGFAAYSASKFGLRGLMEGLSREFSGQSIGFQYLAPRATRTAFNPTAVDALNRDTKVAVDEPADVATALVAAIVRGDRRMQIGWPEKLFARLNGVLPGLVDRSLKSQLPLIHRHARAHGANPTALENHHDPVPL
jgi:short-subunit dehydrogenase